MKYFLCLICAGLLLAGCEKNESGENPVHSQKSGHDHGQEGGGADYVEGKGITMLDETKKSVGLELTEVGETKIQSETQLTAQIYRQADETTRKHGGEKSGMAYASARTSRQIASGLKPGVPLTFQPAQNQDKPHDGRVWKITNSSQYPGDDVEILLELSDPDKSLSVGAFVETRITSTGQSKSAISIPRTALLRTVDGVYVFVENNGYLLRTAVQTGIEYEDKVEITSGLYEGDIIAMKPVETLYMIELRATKGGGHSH